jgi:prophage maintenance system killer protein
MIAYLTIDDCKTQLFPYIQKRMATDEPAPAYGIEGSGLRKLESIFALMERDEYEGLLGKAAYLFCSIIDNHPFSNGNKRLAVTLLIAFLLMNRCKIHGPNMATLRKEMKRFFPHVRWQPIRAFSLPHEHFFYHLALIIADRSQKGHMTFHQEQNAVRSLLVFIAMQSDMR